MLSKSQKTQRYKKVFIELRHMLEVKQSELQKARDDKDYQILAKRKAEADLQKLATSFQAAEGDISSLGDQINNYYEHFQTVQDEIIDLDDQYEQALEVKKQKKETTVNLQNDQ